MVVVMALMVRKVQVLYLAPLHRLVVDMVGD
jgi:hypothetical protein